MQTNNITRESLAAGPLFDGATSRYPYEFVKTKAPDLNRANSLIVNSLVKTKDKYVKDILIFDHPESNLSYL
jgi:hypothetical protein